MGKNVLYVRMKNKEAEEIYTKIQKSGMTINTFVIRSIMKSNPAALATELAASQLNRKKLEEIYIERKRIGNNLNQIARCSNTVGEVEQIRNELAIIFERLRRLGT